jgi:hypothetical protein
MTTTLIYGDSLTDGLEHESFHVETRFGFTTNDMLKENDDLIGIEMLLAEDNYQNVVLICGSNDFDKKDTAGNLDKLYDIIKKCKPNINVYYVNLMNFDINVNIDHIIKLKLEREEDRLHLTEKSKRRLIDKIINEIKKF